MSAPYRPHRSRTAWYGRVVDEVLESLGATGIVLVGNSLGGAVAPAAGSDRISARVLVSPAGFIRLRVDPEAALASAVWLLRPRQEHTRRMLRLFVGPGREPPAAEVEWMTLLATHCRTTLAPPPLPGALLSRRADRECLVTVGNSIASCRPGRWRPRCDGPWAPSYGSSPAWAI
ncbi:alpha/beta hydrolase [Nocardia crassostreae]|uniref:alpha/beta hydrolase n=1 Tax=Nocardia crassostreae TaxID=53428 RepID=UPI000A02C31D|nr:alpha/beta hydrolase [Nocardia crassostreae]